MNRMHSEQDIKDICKITNGSGDIKVYNSGLQVDTNGEPLFNFRTLTAGDLIYVKFGNISADHNMMYVGAGTPEKCLDNITVTSDTVSSL